MPRCHAATMPRCHSAIPSVCQFASLTVYQLARLPAPSAICLSADDNWAWQRLSTSARTWGKWHRLDSQFGCCNSSSRSSSSCRLHCILWHTLWRIMRRATKRELCKLALVVCLTLINICISISDNTSSANMAYISSKTRSNRNCSHPATSAIFNDFTQFE